MPKHLESHAAAEFRTQCMLAYAHDGLTGFLAVVSNYDPENTESFRYLVYFATRYFSVSAPDMATDLKINRDEITKWVDHGIIPSPQEREAVKQYILRQLQGQLASIKNGAAT